MGLFTFLFGKTKFIEDRFFGKLRLINVLTDGSSSFEGKRYFKPLADEIAFTIDADLSGPTQAQKLFFEKIELTYDELVRQIEPLITNEFRNWKPAFTILDFEREFKPVHLEIPSITIEPFSWEIAFETIHDEHTITITWLGFTPSAILIDG